ncbi:RDD family protein [Bosea sp. LjRoot90]|uniref:RDD family protein n=1 Tax=Bosea sp. LjRoot90 TaxID=3342342 RepID=UPI003ECD16CD
MVEPQKLWFWRRSFAVTIDFIVASLIFVLAFTLLTSGTSDTLRLGGFGMITRICGPTKVSPEALAAGNKMMPGVDWTNAAQCNIRSFDITDNRVIVLARHDKQANGAVFTLSVSVPVDTSGNPVSPFYLDWFGLALFLFASLIFLTSRLRATPGMKLMKLQLVTKDGEKAGLKAVILRFLFAYIPVVLIIALGFGTLWLVGVLSLSTWLLAPAFFAALVIALTWWRPFELRRSLPHAPLHDIWAGTRIVRVAPTPAVEAITDTGQ